MMQEQQRADQLSDNPLDYASVVYAVLKKYPALERDEAISIGYETLLRAHKRLHQIGGKEGKSLTSYLYKAVQNALISASQRTTREKMRVFSLEERLEKGRDVEDPHNWIEEIEVLSNCLSFLDKLQEADQVIMRFRYTHPAVSLALTAQLLREQYPHLRLPKKQSGLTKRLQKLQVLYQQSTMEGA